MLTRRHIRRTLRAGQRGVVLFIALIVLVAMTLAAIGLMRSVDTTNLVAGNLAFQQAAIHSGDSAVEAAISWLEDCTKGSGTCALGTLDFDDATHGYKAAGNSSARNPSGSQTWDAFWNATVGSNKFTVPKDSAKNTSYYIIDRLCAKAGKSDAAECASSPLIAKAEGNAAAANQGNPYSVPLVFYRITVRTVGDSRNTVSYIQVMVAL